MRLSLQLRPLSGAVGVSAPRPAWRRIDAAAWVVRAAYLGSLALLLVFVARHASRVPFSDEFANLKFLFVKNLPLTDYWDQHNEHRIPLPRLVYAAAVKATGFDLRAPLYVDAALLAGVTALLLWAVRRARGHASIADAFIPIVVLGVGGYNNLVWAFQVQFILSTVLILAFLALAAVPGFGASAGRLAAAGLVTVLLPLCGANGVAFVPALAAGLGVIGVRNLWAGGPPRSRGVVALLGAAAGLVVLAAYFHGLRKPDYHPPPPNVESVLVGAVNFLGLGFGPVTQMMHEPGYDGVAVLGWVALALAGATGGLLLGAVRDPARRDTALALGCVLGGLLSLTLGLAYGRAGFGSLLPVNRYVQLAVPVLVTAHITWAAFGGRVWGRVVPFALLAVAVASWPTNTRHASAFCGEHTAHLRRVEHEIRSGVPIGFVVDRSPYIYPGPPADLRKCLEILRDEGVKPFDQLAPDPPLVTDSIPVRVVRVEGLEEENGTYHLAGDRGSVVLALPRREHVYGLALTYEAAKPGPLARPTAFLSWDRDARVPPAPGYGISDPLVATTGPTTNRVYVDREADLFRIDLFGAGTTFRVHALAVLRRAE